MIRRHKLVALVLSVVAIRIITVVFVTQEARPKPGIDGKSATGADGVATLPRGVNPGDSPDALPAEQLFSTRSTDYVESTVVKVGIRGTVSTDLLAPIADAKIFSGNLVSHSSLPVCVTDSGGRFEYMGFEITSDRYPTEASFLVAAGGYARAVFLAAPAANPPLQRLVLRPARPISGRVVDHANVPIDGAQVVAQEPAVGRTESRRLTYAAAAHARSSADGSFTVTDVGDRDYELHVFGPEPAAQWVLPSVSQGVHGGDDNVIVRLQRKASSHTLVLRVVLAATGESVTRDTHVSATPTRTASHFDAAQTVPVLWDEAEDALVAKSLESGSYRLLIRTNVGRYTEQEVRVTADSPVTELVVSLHDPGRVYGTVRFDGIERPTIAYVRASSLVVACGSLAWEPSPALQVGANTARLDDSARFFLGDVTPGTVTLTSTGAGYVASATLALGPGETKEVELVAKAAAILSFLSEDRPPLGILKVRIRRPNASWTDQSVLGVDSHGAAWSEHLYLVPGPIDWEVVTSRNNFGANAEFHQIAHGNCTLSSKTPTTIAVRFHE